MMRRHYDARRRLELTGQVAPIHSPALVDLVGRVPGAPLEYRRAPSPRRPVAVWELHATRGARDGATGGGHRASGVTPREFPVGGANFVRAHPRVSTEQRILKRLPVTLELGLLAIVIGLLIALPVGIYSAIRQDTAADYAGRSIAIIGLATPNFWLGIVVLIYPAIWWSWSPPMEVISFSEDPLGNLGVFLIPSLILGTAMSASTMRMTRTMMLEVLRQDFIRTAWSKGLRERAVVLRHAIKNTLIPVVTLIGLQLPILVGGAVIMETLFNLPGLGRLMLDALQDRDYPVVQGTNLFFGTVVLGINLLIDLTYAFLDPRVRYD